MAMDNKELISSRAPAAVGAYPHARKVGNMLYLSGVGPRVKDLDHIPGVELDTDNNIISYPFALILAVISAAFGNFILNKRFTFKEKLLN